jgi:integrase/recombinase XerD
MTRLFRSTLAARMHSFLEIRRAVGRNAYTDEKILAYLDRFLMGELKPGEALTRKVAERWIDGFKHLRIGTRSNRISVLRQLCFYLSRFDKRTCLIPRDMLPRRTRPAPHIYSIGEIKAIMAAAKQIGPPKSLRPLLISTLLGLLYATGLRIGEALKLSLADVDLRRRLLTIRESKFHKSRYVPFSCVGAKHSDSLQNRLRLCLSALWDVPTDNRESRRCFSQLSAILASEVQ